MLLHACTILCWHMSHSKMHGRISPSTAQDFMKVGTLKPSNLKIAMHHRGGIPTPTCRQYNTTVLALVRRHVTIELAVMIAELAFGARVRARRHWNAVRRGLLAFTVFNMLKECFLTAD